MPKSKISDYKGGVLDDNAEATFDTCKAAMSMYPGQPVKSIAAGVMELADFADEDKFLGVVDAPLGADIDTVIPSGIRGVPVWKLNGNVRLKVFIADDGQIDYAGAGVAIDAIAGQFAISTSGLVARLAVVKPSGDTVAIIRPL